MAIRKSKIKHECSICGYLNGDTGIMYKCYSAGCPAYEQDNEEEELEEFGVEEVEDSDEEESDLLCPCGNMRFVIRFNGTDTIALCPECGEQVELD